MVSQMRVPESTAAESEIAPVSAQQVQKLVTDFLSLSPDLKAKLRKMLKP